MDIELSPVSALRMTIAEVYGGMGQGGRVECVGLHVTDRWVGPDVGVKDIYIYIPLVNQPWLLGFTL